MSGPGLARTYSMSVVGIEGHLVDVETYAGAGLVAFTLVGLLDTSVREARDRVRAEIGRASCRERVSSPV